MCSKILYLILSAIFIILSAKKLPLAIILFRVLVLLEYFSFLCQYNLKDINDLDFFFFFSFGTTSFTLYIPLYFYKLWINQRSDLS